ncbi:6-phosphofructokinase [Eubacteriales bacterium OttesenSCG-928-N14]|nr:6-phosphofructokinase [Eubacteriales bacterium OttesenSCG-928-N14]
MKKFGILTGGGDCPGLNAVICGVVSQCAADGAEVFGFRAGWRGALENEGKWISKADVEGIQTEGGTILGTSRTNIMKVENGPERVRQTMQELGLDAIIAIGGDDTLGVAAKLQDMGMNMVGVPKTIDNDLSCTDYTFGFDTAANIAMESIDRLHTTAKSHDRVIVVEIMGRHTGWIAVQAGMAGDAHVVMIPEFPMTVQQCCDILLERKSRGHNYAIVALAEGISIDELSEEDLPRDVFGNIAMVDKGIGETLAKLIRERTGMETRHMVLGHLQRGGPPSLFDRVLGLRMGVKAAQCAITGEYGYMMGLRGTEIVPELLSKAVDMRKEVDAELYHCAELLFG